MVDGDTGNAGLVILHLLQSEEAIMLTFLSRRFELISQSLHINLSFPDFDMLIPTSEEG
ncbi:hypothetical protein [Escherichia coli]|uniref:hypothetical protein n=1 Tax=Escherichia coli TaxID=562 RepID=UPI001656893B|nr:hypothetical protein [Escherichia coli]